MLLFCFSICSNVCCRSSVDHSRVHYNRLHPWWTVYPSKQWWLDLITRICIFPNREGVSQQEVHIHTLFYIVTITLILWGCITMAAKQWTQMTFEISFPQMTHDSLSAVKTKQTLYGSHHAAQLGNNEHKWYFCMHVCAPTHNVQRSKVEFTISDFLVFPNGQASRLPVLQWREITPTVLPPTKKKNLLHSETQCLAGAPNSYTQKHRCHLEPPFSLSIPQSCFFLVCQIVTLSADPKQWKCDVDLAFREQVKGLKLELNAVHYVNLT